MRTLALPEGDILAQSHIGQIIFSTTLDTEEKVKRYYGGESWSKIEGRFLLGASSDYEVNSTGGESTCTLKQTNLPNYKIGFLPTCVPINHSDWSNSGIQSSSDGSPGNKRVVLAANDNNTTNHTQYGWDIYTAGGNQPHNNMPPYKAVYIWERTA